MLFLGPSLDQVLCRSIELAYISRAINFSTTIIATRELGAPPVLVILRIVAQKSLSSQHQQLDFWT